MIATMKATADNSGDMIKELQFVYNNNDPLSQHITRKLTEIILEPTASLMARFSNYA